jgi:hypothetical protein
VEGDRDHDISAERQSDGTAEREPESKQEAERRLPCTACCASDFLEETVERMSVDVFGLWGCGEPHRSLVLCIEGVNGKELIPLPVKELADLFNKFLEDPFGQLGGSVKLMNRVVMTPVKADALGQPQNPSA